MRRFVCVISRETLKFCVAESETVIMSPVGPWLLGGKRHVHGCRGEVGHSGRHANQRRA
jgi:hypothetical protein